jgi:fatty acid desaturase
MGVVRRMLPALVALAVLAGLVFIFVAVGWLFVGAVVIIFVLWGVLLWWLTPKIVRTWRKASTVPQRSTSTSAS